MKSLMALNLLAHISIFLLSAFGVSTLKDSTALWEQLLTGVLIIIFLYTPFSLIIGCLYGVMRMFGTRIDQLENYYQTIPVGFSLSYQTTLIKKLQNMETFTTPQKKMKSFHHLYLN